MTDFNAQALGCVAVLMGGWSAEREVSLKSGRAVYDALLRQGVNAVAIDAGRDLLMQLTEHKIDRVFNVLHGRGGEDGVVQGALELIKMPYTGAGVQGSALGMDKERCKLIWLGAGLPTPRFMMVPSRDDLPEVVKALGLPLAIKPAREGSSIGISRVDQPSDLLSAWEMASKYDHHLMAEQWISGAEYTVSILDGKPLPAIKLETDRRFYDYEAKYQSNDTRYICPCGLTKYA